MLELISRGGWALWVITIFSILGWGCILERWFTLRRADIDSEDLLERVSKLLDRQDITAAIALCNENGGPVGETLAIGLRKLLFLENAGKRPEEIEQGIVAAMEEHGPHVVGFLERNLTWLATVSSLGPILGMLGTVVGMIKAFGVVKTVGALTPEAVAGGIAEALLCTAGGLVLAAVGTAAYNYYSDRVNYFVLRVQAAATRLVEKIVDLQYRQGRQAEGTKP